MRELFILYSRSPSKGPLALVALGLPAPQLLQLDFGIFLEDLVLFALGEVYGAFGAYLQLNRI